MSENEILEMESVCDTDEFDGDVHLGMVDEETGERNAADLVLLLYFGRGHSLDCISNAIMSMWSNSFITNVKCVLSLLQ